MKFESLNNSKYSLTPEKMGQLVGGKIETQVTGAGKTYSSEAWVSRSGYDACAGNAVLYESEQFSGENDKAAANNWCEKQSKISYPCYTQIMN